MIIHDIAAAPVEQARRAARSWATGKATLQTSIDDLRNLGDLPSWSGQAANSMRHRIDSSAHRMHATAVAATGTSFLLETQSGLVASAQVAVRPTLALASAAGMAVTADGTVVPGGGGGVMGVVSGVAAAVPLSHCRRRSPWSARRMPPPVPPSTGAVRWTLPRPPPR